VSFTGDATFAASTIIFNNGSTVSSHIASQQSIGITTRITKQVVSQQRQNNQEIVTVATTSAVELWFHHILGFNM
jgi:hypothetical protein